jgi:hypothetical protein
MARESEELKRWLDQKAADLLDEAAVGNLRAEAPERALRFIDEIERLAREGEPQIKMLGGGLRHFKVERRVRNLLWVEFSRHRMRVRAEEGTVVVTGFVRPLEAQDITEPEGREYGYDATIPMYAKADDRLRPIEVLTRFLDVATK